MILKIPPPDSVHVDRRSSALRASREVGGLGLIRWEGLTVVGELSRVDRLVSVSGLVEGEGGVYRPIHSLMLEGDIDNAAKR